MLDPRGLDLAHRTAVRWFRMTLRCKRHLARNRKFESTSLQRRVVRTRLIDQKRDEALPPENARPDGGSRVTVANTPPSSLQLALHGRGYRPPHYLVPRWRWRWCRYCAGDRAKRAAGCCPESSWRREVTGQVDAHQPDCGHSFPTIGWPRCAWVAGVSSLHGYDAPRDLALGNSKALQVGDSSYRKVEVYF